MPGGSKDISLYDAPACDEITINSREEWIVNHGSQWEINSAWWNKELRHLPGEMSLYETKSGRITRGDLFHLGEKAHTSPSAALSMLWAACAWGKGTGVFGIKPMLQSVALNPPGEKLCRAAELAREDPDAAFAQLIRSEGNLVKGLGPSFATKYLYFAGAGNALHPSLILDSRVALALRKMSDRWSWLPAMGASAQEYKRYCDILAAWAKTTSDKVGRTVGGDEFERILFEQGG